MKRLGNLICKLNGKKSEVSIGDTYENLRIQAAIRAVYYVCGDDKCRSAIADYSEYLNKFLEKAGKLMNRGMNADEILLALIGNKKPRQESQRGSKKKSLKPVR